TLISSFFSYEPAVSLRKMVTVSLVTIVYLVSEFVADRVLLRRIVLLTLTAGFISTLWTFGVLAVGKNMKVTRLAPDSILRQAGVLENDTILKVDGRAISSPDD